MTIFKCTWFRFDSHGLWRFAIAALCSAVCCWNSTPISILEWQRCAHIDECRTILVCWSVRCSMENIVHASHFSRWKVISIEKPLVIRWKLSCNRVSRSNVSCEKFSCGPGNFCWACYLVYLRLVNFFFFALLCIQFPFHNPFSIFKKRI